MQEGREFMACNKRMRGGKTGRRIRSSARRRRKRFESTEGDSRKEESDGGKEQGNRKRDQGNRQGNWQKGQMLNDIYI